MSVCVEVDFHWTNFFVAANSYFNFHLCRKTRVEQQQIWRLLTSRGTILKLWLVFAFGDRKKLNLILLFFSLKRIADVISKLRMLSVEKIRFARTNSSSGNLPLRASYKNETAKILNLLELSLVTAIVKRATINLNRRNTIRQKCIKQK